MNILIFFFILFFPWHNQTHRIALCIVATGNYAAYAYRLIQSAKSHFCKNHQVTFFVFTDKPSIIGIEHNVYCIPQKKLGWPLDTLMRFSIYQQHAAIFEPFDYIFASDADMLFVDEVDDEILGNLVATKHPGFINKRGTYETNTESTACIYPYEGEYYFAGGFFGARRQEFLQMIDTISKKIFKDLKKEITALWHDESHLNRYFIDHKPTTILSPSYCYPEGWHIPYQKKLIALNKHHAQLRG